MEDTKMAVLGSAVLLLAGVFCAFCAFKDYDWFMNNRKAWLIVKIFGRRIARAFYIVLGLLLAGAGCVMLFASATRAI
jgi:hypothetical protein